MSERSARGSNREDTLMALVFHADGTAIEHGKVIPYDDQRAADRLLFNPEPDPLRDWWAWLDRDDDWIEDNVTQ